MKRLFISAFILLVSSVCLNAQFTKIGGGVSYTTGFHFDNVKTGPEADMYRSPFLGIFITGIYEITLPIHIAPSFTYFIPRTNTSTIVTANEGNSKVSSMMFDINGHFVFNSLDRFEFYGIGGINMLFTGIKWSGPSPSAKDNAIGLNLGLGSYMKIAQQVDLFLEAKYLVSKYSQFMANFGVLVNIDYIIKHKKEPI